MQTIIRKFSFIALGVYSLFLAACSKSDDGVSTPYACDSTPTGAVTMLLYAKYDNILLSSSATHADTAYIKYGALESPGSLANYDAYFVGTPGSQTISIPGLRCGSYYIYRTAWDEAAGVTRYGGAAVPFKKRTGVKTVKITVN